MSLRPTPHAPSRTALVALVTLAVFTAAPAATVAGGSLPAVPAQTAPPLAPQPTALLVSAINAPLRVPGSDGMTHVEYDLLVANAFSAPVTLTAIEVLAPDARTAPRCCGSRAPPSRR